MMGFGGGVGVGVVGDEANEIVSKGDDDFKDDEYSDDDGEINTFQMTTRAKKMMENFSKLLENCGDCRSDDILFFPENK